MHSVSACSECGAQGDDFPAANIEVFELTGELVCDDCADSVFERLGEDEA